MEGQEVEQTLLQLESASETQEQQTLVQEKQEEEPELQKENPCSELEPEPEKQLEPEKVQEPETEKLCELVSENQLELEPPTQLKPDPGNCLEPELSPVKQPELSPVKQPELSPVKQPELSPVKEPELSPVKQPELSPVKQPELSPVKQPEQSPVKQPEQSPVMQPVQSPVKQPEPESEQHPEPEKQPELSPVNQPEPEPKKHSEPEKQPELSPVKQPELSPVKQPELSPVKQPEPEPEKQVEQESKQVRELETQAEPEMKPEPEADKQEQEEPLLETQDEQQQQASEIETPAPIVPGSLSFAILEEERTKTALRTSHTLIIIRGLPGSGKTRLANAISEHYQGICTIISADDYNIKPENPNSSEGHKALDEAVVVSCTSGTTVVVVDDTNHTHGRLARLEELAEQQKYYTLFLEPRTEWCQDVEQLVQKNKRGLDKSQIQALKGPLEETCLPLFFGWFICPSFQDKLRSMTKDFLKNLEGLEAFKKHLGDFTGEAEKEVDLDQFFQDKGRLHCTTMFCDHGKAEGSKGYAEQQAVKDRYGSISELTLSALFFTPRTLGARVSLTEEQLQLWPAGAEKEDVPDVDLPPGSRAHITLGCAEGVEPMQTGLDLLELIQLQQQGQEGEQVQDLELGPLAYYGKGMWVLSLRESILAPACFSSFFGSKKEDGKKEVEKKKRFKCNLQ